MKISVKSSSDAKFDVEVVDLDTTTVLALKGLIMEKANVPVESQRLIYSGKLLKDGDFLSFYNIGEGHTIHMVKGSKSSNSNTSTSSTSTTPTARVPPTGTTTSPSNPIPQQPAAQPATTPSMNPFGMNINNNNNPADPSGALMQSLFQNPELLRSLLQSPMMQQNMRNMGLSSGMVEQMLQDPAVLNLMSNPQLLQEMRTQMGAFGMGGGMGGGIGGGMEGMGGFPFLNPQQGAGGAFPPTSCCSSRASTTTRDSLSRTIKTIARNGFF
jgi:ubiquilin